ncbi:hypothetical protein [Nocardioides sp. WS12]|uniref:hypothetical protein n=1 Tax=Nocardioides sp. WS12 TaxID=2486272 RepID=UPI0015F94F9C|nr:hypothetical protein [Nocardioides sp. WS12]
MALAGQTDVEARLGRELTTGEILRLPALLDDASAIVIGYCGQDFEPAPYPSAVIGVTAKMVARGLTAASNVGSGMAQQQTAGPFSVTYSASSTTGDMWMTAADKLALRGYRLGGGLRSVGLVGARYEITETAADSSSSSSSSSSS